MKMQTLFIHFSVLKDPRVVACPQRASSVESLKKPADLPILETHLRTDPAGNDFWITYLLLQKKSG